MQSEQLIRVVRASRTPSGIEQSYRLLIDELPQPGEAPTNGVSIRLRYSIPVFVRRGQRRAAARLGAAAQQRRLGAAGAQRRRAPRSSRRSARDRRRPRVPAHARIARLRARGPHGPVGVPLPAGVTLGGKVTVRAAVNSQPASAVVSVEPPG